MEFNDADGGLIDARQIRVAAETDWEPDSINDGLRANPLVSAKEFLVDNSDKVFLLSPLFTSCTQHTFRYAKGLKFRMGTQLTAESVADISQIKLKLTTY